MLMGRITGTVVSTQKDDGMRGFKLVTVQNVDLGMVTTPTYTVAVDAVGAGVGELVIVVQGSSARLTEATRNRPIDAAVVCIVDTVDLGGRVVYDKREDGLAPAARVEPVPAFAPVAAASAAGAARTA